MWAAHHGHGELLEQMLLSQWRRPSCGRRFARAARGWLLGRRWWGGGGGRGRRSGGGYNPTRVLELAALHCPAPTLRRLFLDWVPSGLVKWHTRFSLGWLAAPRM